MTSSTAPAECLAAYRKHVDRMVRAVLLVHPDGIEFPEPFLAEYRNFVQESINFGALGYGSVREMIEDMKDVVRVKEDGSRTTLKAVSDWKTEHIEEMTKKQKKPPQAKRRPRGDVVGPPNGQRKPLGGEVVERILALIRQNTRLEPRKVTKRRVQLTFRVPEIFGQFGVT